MRVAVRNSGGQAPAPTWSPGQRTQVTWRPADAQVLEP